MRVGDAYSCAKVRLCFMMIVHMLDKEHFTIGSIFFWHFEFDFDETVEDS